MKSILELMGFPPAERRDSVRFHFAKNLPYVKRTYLFFALLAGGLGLQLLWLTPWFGLPFLIAAYALMAVKGYDSRVRLKAFKADKQWTQVPITQLVEIEQLRKRTQRWDRDALDISNGFGCFMLALLAGGGVIVAFLFGALARNERLTWIIGLDWLLLLGFCWFTGMRFITKQANLEIRIKLILELYDNFVKIKRDGEEFKPQLMLAKGKDGKTVPIDARFSIALPQAPEGFYGLQAQINLNVVQGTSYPYFYCVLAAKPGFGLSRFRGGLTLADKVICEYQEDEQAEVLVIRQQTTKTSGYHTKNRICSAILQNALDGARLICGRERAGAAAR